MRKRIQKNKGFTLVELAIVLVIIGLIVSSVLVGQDLIKSAELRATTRQYQEFQTAVGTFIGTYNQLPGDIDGDAFGLSGGCDAGTDGDGDQDGVIEDADGGGSIAEHDGEISCFWANLTTDGKELIPGTYDGADGSSTNTVGENMPQMKLGSSGWGVFSTGGNSYFITGVISGSAANSYDTQDIFAPLDAFNIDDKIDDGAPASGSVVSVSAQTSGAPNTSDLGAGTPGSSDCYENDTTPTSYNFSTTNSNCVLRFDMNTF